MQVTPNCFITPSSDVLHHWDRADTRLRLLAGLCCMTDGWFVQDLIETQVTVELLCPLPHPDCSAALIFSVSKCSLSFSQNLRKPKIPDICICYWYSFTNDVFSWAFLSCFSRSICHATWKYPALYFLQPEHKNYLFNQREYAKGLLFKVGTERKRLNKERNFNIKKCSCFLTIPDLLLEKPAFCRLTPLGHK